MLSTLVYVALPVLVLGFLRKYIERKWVRFEDRTSLEGKVIIVTGATSGIGKETVKGLVDRHAKVIMACRDIMGARKTIHDIRRTTKNGYMIPLYLDLECFESIRMFTNVVLQDYKQIHVLINNAGVAMPNMCTTKDGLELNFGVNYVGHFILTKLLLERLKICAPSRIVILSSTLMKYGVIDFTNLNGEKGFDTDKRRLATYSNSKLQNAYFGNELANRTRNTGVSVYTVSPGLCNTRLFRYTNLKWYRWLTFLPVAFFIMRSAEQGSQTVLYCAASEDVKDQSGLMYQNCKVFPTKFDPEISKKLWEVTDNLIKRSGNF